MALVAQRQQCFSSHKSHGSPSFWTHLFISSTKPTHSQGFSAIMWV